MDNKRHIAILGSTGSIGRQTLDIISEYPDKFAPFVLTANTSVDLLIQQSLKYHPRYAIVADESGFEKLRDALAGTETEVACGAKAIADIVTAPEIDIVVTAMVGYSGLEPTIRAIEAGKDIALANKETLVVAGALITNMLTTSTTKIYPVDSEHGAIYQCLVGERHEDVSKLILTASGGPFRTWSREDMARVTKADALRHPNWSMGAKITIDSATMMNKGFEVMEAKWLFGVEASQIEVLVHPQSIVHSAVQFADGAVKAQLGVPDMRLPIQYAFSYPSRLHLSSQRLNLLEHPLEFFKPDMQKFRCLALAFEALEQGGNMPCIVNAANEVVNKGFLEDRCGFLQMSHIIEQTMGRVPFDATPDYDTYVATDREARRVAAELLR